MRTANDVVDVALESLVIQVAMGIYHHTYLSILILMFLYQHGEPCAAGFAVLSRSRSWAALYYRSRSHSAKISRAWPSSGLASFVYSATPFRAYGLASMRFPCCNMA